MKALILALILSGAAAQAAENVTCVAKATTQHGLVFKTDAKISFLFEENGKQSSLSQLTGHIFVQGAYEDKNEPITPDNAYMGYFDFAKMQANPAYKPLKYTDFAQFKDFNAQKTTGLEDGMWGYLLVQTSINRKNPAKIEAKYIFQAGDHMGGTVHFDCFVKQRLGWE